MSDREKTDEGFPRKSKRSAIETNLEEETTATNPEFCEKKFKEEKKV